MPSRNKGRRYSQAHRTLRASWQPAIDTGTVTCWRCGEHIRPREPWDLGHDDTNHNLHRGPEHAARCNRAAAARHQAGKRQPERHPGRITPDGMGAGSP